MNYFEYIVLIVQDYLLVAIVLFYRQSITKKALIITSVYFTILTLFAMSILPKSILLLCLVSIYYIENSMTYQIKLKLI